MVQLEATDISTVNLVMECWFAQTACPAGIGAADARQTSPPPLMSLSYEERPLLLAGGRTASPGAVETGLAEAGRER